MIKEDVTLQDDQNVFVVSSLAIWICIILNLAFIIIVTIYNIPSDEWVQQFPDSIPSGKYGWIFSIPSIIEYGIYIGFLAFFSSFQKTEMSNKLRSSFVLSFILTAGLVFLIIFSPSFNENSYSSIFQEEFAPFIVVIYALNFFFILLIPRKRIGLQEFIERKSASENGLSIRNLHKQQVDVQKQIEALNLPGSLQLEGALAHHENRVKVFRAGELYARYKVLGGDMDVIPNLPILDNKTFHGLLNHFKYVDVASHICGKLIDSQGKWKKNDVWFDVYKYESGLPRDFQSGELVKFLGVIDDQLYFFLALENESTIALSCINRVQAIPTREKVRLRISWRDKKHGLKDTVLYVDANSEVTRFNNGKSRTDWDNSNAIRVIDELQQEINHARESMVDLHADKPISVSSSIEALKYRNDLERMIKSATSPKELLTDVHGIMESMLQNIFTFASPQIKPAFAELINFADEEGIIDDAEALHQARVIRNNRSHRGHEVSDEDCLAATKTYAHAIRSTLEKLEMKATEKDVLDWRDDI